MHAPSLDQFGQKFANAQEGCEAATQDLVDDYFGPLTAFFERRGAHDPESSANDALERAIRKGDSERIDSGPAFRAFLYAIARNQAKNEFRTRERRVTIDLVDEPIDLDLNNAAPSAENVVFDGLMAADLLTQVKPDQAEVLELRFIDGYSVKETAALTGKSVPAINALQRRGLATLRQVVGAVVVVLLVLLGVRFATDQAERGPVISDDLPSEIGELPADGDGDAENGAPLIVETEEPGDGGAKEVRKNEPATEVAGISTTVTVPTPQAQLLDDLLRGLATGQLPTEDVDDTPEGPKAPIVTVNGAGASPAGTTDTGTDTQATPAEDDDAIDITLPWVPEVGDAAALPNLPAPLIRPATPGTQDRVAPVVVDDGNDEEEASPTSSTTTSSTTTSTTSTSTPASSSSTAPTSSSTAPTTVVEEDDGSGVIPAVTEPIGDAFGAIKSLVTSPVSWFEDTTEAIDVSQ